MYNMVEIEGALPRRQGMLRGAVMRIAGIQTLWCIFVVALFGCEPGPRVSVEYHRAVYAEVEGLVPMLHAESGRVVYVYPNPVITNRDVAFADATSDPWGEPTVRLVLNPSGSQKMDSFSREHKGKPLAVLIDGRLVMVAEIKDTLNGMVHIVGGLSEEESRTIARGINNW